MENLKDIFGNPVNSQVDLQGLELPSRKDEFWRYSPVSGIKKGQWIVGKPGADATSSDTIVIENGRLTSSLSAVPEGVVVEHLSGGAKPNLGLAGFNDVFEQINAAYATEGVSIHIGKNIVPAPIRIQCLTSESDVLSAIQNSIVVEAGSKATVILEYLSKGSDKAFTVPSTQVELDANTSLELVILQEENDQAQHVENIQVEQAEGSHFKLFTLTTGGAFVRNNVHVEHKGSNITTDLFGAYVPTGSQHMDNHTRINHMHPHCESNELYKGILSDKGTGVFNGKVFVDKEAQKTNAFQSNQNILLSDEADMNSKPELEIYADDVKCSHGSTTGALDESALFYLQSRGIGKTAGRKLLIQAFVNEVYESLESEDLREEILGRLNAKLEQL